jgi:hypothetical protein
LRRGVWELAVVALVVGTSAALVRLMGGTYTDNLIAEALFAAALVPALSSVRDGRGFVAGVLLIAIGGLAHPAFYAFMLGVLALVAVAYLPESWRSWRRKDAALLGTPSARLAVLLAGSGAITAIGIYGFLGAVPDQPALQRRTFLQRFKDDLPLYRFYLTAPLAAAGAGSLWRSSRPTVADGRRQGSGQDPNRFAARFVLLLFLAWTVATAVGILGLLAGRALPAHRFLAFFLPLPILAALGVLAVCRFLRTRTTRSAAIGVAALCVVGLMALGGLDYHVIAGRGVEVLDDGKVHDAVAASTYLNALRVPVDAPVIVVITDTGPQPQLVIPEEAHMLRSAFQPERVPHLYFYVGRPDLALAGQPTLVPNDARRFNVVSTRFFNSLQPILNQEPIVLLLASYNPAFNVLLPLHPDWIVAQDVMALRGPRPLAPVAVPPFPTAPHRAALPLLGSAALVVLALLGMGWALALLPAGVRPFEVLALSLSFGLALLIVAGIAADALGVRLVGWGAVLPAVILSLVGWAAGGARVTRHGLASVLAL